MSARLSTRFGVALGLWGIAQAHAQLSPGPEDAVNLRADNSNGPVDHQTASGSLAQIAAERSSSKVSIQYSVDGQTIRSTGSHDAKAHFSDLVLTASSPLSKDGNNTDLATLDGLTNATTIGFKYSSYDVPGMRPSVTKSERDICATAKARVVPASDQAKFQCSTMTVQRWAPELLPQFRASAWAGGKLRTLWGVSGDVGLQQSKYFSSSTLESDTTEKHPWSAGVYAGVSPSSSLTLITASFTFQQTYEDQKTQTYCPVAESGSTTAVQCTTGSFGSPSNEKKELLSLEARQLFPWVAASLKATYDAEKKVFGIDLPIYLIPDNDGKLSAGIRVGWRDDTHDVTAGVFVGVPFSLSGL